MTSLPDIFAWIRSHGEKLRRKGYEPPNHLSNGYVRFFGSDIGAVVDVAINASGDVPSYVMEPAPSRIEVYGADRALLYAEGS